MISKNAAGIVFLLLSLVGLEVAESEVVDAISAIGTVISFALMIYNQWTRRDTTGFFFKK